MGIRHGGWRPERLREAREARGLTVSETGGLLREAVRALGLTGPEAAEREIRRHETGEAYPAPGFRRAYCLALARTESGLGFRDALPGEAAGAVPLPALTGTWHADLRAALERSPGPLTGTAAQDVCRRIASAWSARRAGAADEARPTLLLVCGYAGSGKSEFARFVSRMTGWPVLDKDPLARPLVERLLAAAGCEPDDRHSVFYREQVRPQEYACLMAAADACAEAGASAVLSAPFVAEVTDPGWLERLAERCAAHGTDVSVAWVHSDPETMHEHITFRAAARDRWKLGHWDAYAAGLDPDLRPAGPHLLVDNRGGSAVSFTDQVLRLFGGAAAESPRKGATHV